jgi:hypothetical protein
MKTEKATNIMSDKYSEGKAGTCCSRQGTGKSKDPVCGMDVEPASTEWNMSTKG